MTVQGKSSLDAIGNGSQCSPLMLEMGGAHPNKDGWPSDAGTFCIYKKGRCTCYFNKLTIKDTYYANL